MKTPPFSTIRYKFTQSAQRGTRQAPPSNHLSYPPFLPPFLIASFPILSLKMSQLLCLSLFGV